MGTANYPFSDVLTSSYIAEPLGGYLAARNL
jgi:hypothetical protein